jgi:hypothetical protein
MNCDRCNVPLSADDTCPSCGVLHGEECYACGGRGYHEHWCPEAEDCAACGNNGYFPCDCLPRDCEQWGFEGLADCPKCGGDGSYPCPDCNPVAAEEYRQAIARGAAEKAGR